MASDLLDRNVVATDYPSEAAAKMATATILIVFTSGLDRCKTDWWQVSTDPEATPLASTFLVLNSGRNGEKFYANSCPTRS